jgi:hypothetical protein
VLQAQCSSGGNDPGTGRRRALKCAACDLPGSPNQLHLPVARGDARRAPGRYRVSRVLAPLHF